MNPHPIGTFARLAFARARRGSSVELEHQVSCTGICSHVPEEVWSALDSAYPDVPIEGPRHRQVLAALFAPLMAVQGWRFCRCYLTGFPATGLRRWDVQGGLPEHRFISRLVDTGEANTAADLAVEFAGGAR